MRIPALAHLALVLLASAFSPCAMAQTSDPLLEARLSLRTYDLEGSTTTDVVAALTRLLSTRLEPARAREARFLRAVVTADVWLSTSIEDAHGVRSRLATGWGLDLEALPSAVERDLAASQVGAYGEASTDALAALHDRSLALPPSDPSYTRRQIGVLLRLAERLRSSTDPTAILAPLASDPCAETSPCEAPYAHFGPRGRRAIAAMAQVVGLLRAVERVAELGDPAARAFRSRRTLEAPTLAPPDWATRVAVSGPVSGGRPLEADAVIVIGPQQVRLGGVPTVRWDEEGAPRVVASPPLLGSDEASSWPVTPTIARLDALLPALDAQARGRRVAVLVEPGTDASLLSLVLETLRGSPHEPRAVGVATREGMVQSVPIESVVPAEPRGEGVLGLFVRQGGLTVRQAGGSTSLPRLRVEDRWQFDLEGLARLVAAGEERRVGLRYMDTADASVVVRAAIVAAGSSRALAIVP